MLKKNLLGAAAALAVATGAFAAKIPDANAGGKFSPIIGGYNRHSFHGGYTTFQGGGSHGCSTKFKKQKVQVWTKWGPKWVWVNKPVRSCR